MPEPPRRARFQIHLSTAIVMMFVAGGLIWANVKERIRSGDIGGIALTSEPYFVKGTETEFLTMPNATYWDGNRTFIYGWPYAGISIRKPFYREANGDTFYPKLRTDVPGVYVPDEVLIDKGALAVNVGFMTIVLLASWFLCEWLIRRRAGREGA